MDSVGVSSGLTSSDGDQATAARSAAKYGGSQERICEIHTTPRYRSPTYGCSFIISALLLLSTALLVCTIHSSFYHQLDPKGCVMTYMYPAYYKILGFDEEKTQLAGKYGLMLYKNYYDDSPPVSDASQLTQVGEFDFTIAKSAKIQPTGTPVLFIPGNAGSAKQVRSIATETWNYYQQSAKSSRDGPGTDQIRVRPIDFFSVDFNEEFSAFHGQLLLDQAQYVNEVIAFILSLYGDRGSSFPRPSSVLVIGHSMGGIVARTIFTMDSYLPGSVSTILTLATPHMVPPLALDYEITEIYERIETFWNRGYEGPHSPLANVSLVSILGGNQDITVNSDAGNIHHIVPQSHGFSVFTSSIPHAWVGSDHLSILWCNQVASTIAKTLGDVVDGRIPGQVKPLSERMKLFRKRLLTGSIDQFDYGVAQTGEETISLSEISHSFEKPGNIWAYPPIHWQGMTPPQKSNKHLYILTIPKNKELDILRLLTDVKYGPLGNLAILFCKDKAQNPGSGSSLPSTVLSCVRDRLSAVPIPLSTTVSTMPLYEGNSFTGEYQLFVSKSLRDFADFQYMMVEDRGRAYSDRQYLITEFANEASTVDTVKTSTIGLLRNGIVRSKFPTAPSLVTTLRLSNVANSLLTYNLMVKDSSCNGSNSQRFQPMMKQSSWTMNEDKYAVNIANKALGIDINFHGDLPYFDKILLREDKGIDLLFWTDPTCAEQLSFTLTVDKYGSLGKVVIRYRTSVIVFTFMVVVLTLRAQIKGWSRTGDFQPFGLVLSRLAKSLFWQVSIGFAIVSVVQSLKSELVRLSPITLVGTTDWTLSQDSWFSGAWIDNMLLGRNDIFFAFLAPVFFQLAVGIVVFVWFVLNSIVRIVALFMRIIIRDSATGHSDRQGTSIVGTVTMAGIFILVATVVPYQFAFAATTIALIGICASLLARAQRMPSTNSEVAWGRFHFSMAMLVMFFFLLPFFVPVLMVWIRNLAVGWLKSFPSDHRVDYVAPFIVFVENLAQGSAVTRTSWKRYVRITIGLLDGMMVYLVLFGVRYSWQIYFLTRLWVSWLVVLRFLETNIGKAMESRIRRAVLHKQE
ncbi:GPI inositol deacylase [Gamsiella multidivaricata]|nr:GPI inositol deacylase [Gamsiella multidivaricata]